MISSERLIQTFLDLCHISSPSFNERKMGDYVREYCEHLGLEVREDDAGKKIGGNCGNIIVKLPGRGQGFFNVLLSAHMDTVEPTEGIKIIREGGVIKTDGRTILGGDDKIGVAVLLEAVRSLIESGEDYAGGLIVFTVAEEQGLLGASSFDAAELKEIDFGFVFDTGPEVGGVVMRTPFHYEFKVVIEGVAAHAGREPEKGVSAIQLAAKSLANAPQGRINEETTCNYGMIKGGEMNNVVCPRVEVRGEVRSYSETGGQMTLGEIEENFRKNIDGSGGRYEFCMGLHAQPYFHKESDKVLQYIQSSLLRVGISPILKSNLGSSDANIWNLRGISCLNIGVGMQSIHTPQEHCYEENIVAAVHIVKSILQTNKNDVDN